MPFFTKIDISNNRQIKQYSETFTALSGGTKFGLPFSALTKGPDLTTTAITSTISNIITSFSGNNTTTIFNWVYPSMNIAYSTLSAITPSNSAITQNTGAIFNSSLTGTTIDNNLVTLIYSGLSFDITCSLITDLGGGNYSGNVLTNSLNYYSAGTLDYTGRTIWVDVSGITRTNDLIISNNPTIGYVWTCLNTEGKGYWANVGSGVSFWSAGSGTNAIVMNNSEGTSNGLLSISEGFRSTAIGDYSHAKGVGTLASGYGSYTEGNLTTASGYVAHAEGGETVAIGDNSHAEGGETTAIGISTHTEGSLTTAIGDYSHAGGTQTIASGVTSFVHGTNSIAGGLNTIVLGSNITGNSDNHTYVDSLNIKTIGSSPFTNDIRIDANGYLTTNTSDIRLKENIRPIKNAVDIIKNLNGIIYEWKDKKSGGDDSRYGFIAQDVEAIDPLLAFTNKNDGLKGIHIDGIIPLLVECVKLLVNGDFIKTQTIIAEDNNIELNYNGNTSTAINGGLSVLHGLSENNSAEFILNTNGNWTTNTGLIPKNLSIPFYTPTSSNDNNGDLSNITHDDNYLYIKTKDGWRRIPMEVF